MAGGNFLICGSHEIRLIRPGPMGQMDRLGWWNVGPRN